MQDIRDPYGIFSKVCFSRFPTPTPVSSTPLALLTSFVSPYLLSYLHAQSVCLSYPLPVPQHFFLPPLSLLYSFCGLS